MNAKTIYKRGVMRLGRREKKNERASKVFEEAREKDGEAKVSVKLVTFVVIAGLAIVGYSEAWGFDWKYYGTNEEGTYFYEIETMTSLSQNIIRVCVQSIYTEKGISHWVKGGGKEFLELEFSLILSELNCVEKSIRHLRIVFYSKNGEIFYPIKNEEWHLFAPDSMSRALFQEICK
jgi:hypothetical protein